MKADKKYVIVFDNGSFFQSLEAARGKTTLEAAQGGTKEQAQQFNSEEEADQFMREHEWILFYGGMAIER